VCIRTGIGVLFSVVFEFALAEVAFPVIGTTITDDAVDVALFQPSADGRCEITGIQPYSFNLETEALPHLV